MGQIVRQLGEDAYCMWSNTVGSPASHVVPRVVAVASFGEPSVAQAERDLADGRTVEQDNFAGPDNATVSTEQIIADYWHESPASYVCICECGLPHLGGTEHADECPFATREYFASVGLLAPRKPQPPTVTVAEVVAFLRAEEQDERYDSFTHGTAAVGELTQRLQRRFAPAAEPGSISDEEIIQHGEHVLLSCRACERPVSAAQAFNGLTVAIAPVRFHQGEMFSTGQRCPHCAAPDPFAGAGKD